MLAVSPLCVFLPSHERHRSHLKILQLSLIAFIFGFLELINWPFHFKVTLLSTSYRTIRTASITIFTIFHTTSLRSIARFFLLLSKSFSIKFFKPFNDSVSMMYNRNDPDQIIIQKLKIQLRRRKKASLNDTIIIKFQLSALRSNKLYGIKRLSVWVDELNHKMESFEQLQLKYWIRNELETMNGWETETMSIILRDWTLLPLKSTVAHSKNS